MPDFDIRSQSGEQFSIGGQITKPDFEGQPPAWPPYPANAAGFELLFTAKRRKNDPALVTRNSNDDPTNVVLANGGTWTVRLLDDDTHAFTRAEDLLYEVALIEPDGTATVIASGRWIVEKSVGL